jgi:hypothetical protein
MEIESIQIHLNSANATSYIGDSYSNCVFTIPTLEIPSQHQIYLSVKHANIPYSFYNIDTTNNTLIYIQNGTTTTLNIEPGNYNANQLSSYLTNNMTNFTITYNSITNKFLFTNSVYNFTISQLSTCLTMFGLISNAIYLSSSLKSLTSYQCANLQTKQCICISSNFQTGNINFTDILTRTILCSIPISTPPNSNIVYINSTNFRNNLYTNIINTICLKLIDQNNNIINLNGCHWSITLQLDVVNFVL